MKMDRQNHGGEGGLSKSMKGAEKYQARGKGNVLGAYPQIGSGRPGISGMGKGAHVRATSPKTSFSGSTVTGSSKAAR